MAIQMSEGFSLLSKEALDNRFIYKSISDMVAMEEYTLYDGILAVVNNDIDQKTYQWWSNNAIDPTLGKWREFSGSGGGTGEEVSIKTISVNGENINPDAQKNVDIDIPIIGVQTTTSEGVVDLTPSDRKVNIDLTPYALKSETGATLDLSMDTSTYVMTLKLQDKDGNNLSEKTLDLPLESMIINGSYADGILSLELNAPDDVDPSRHKLIKVDITDIVSGLVADTFMIAGLPLKNVSNEITKEELLTALGISEGGGVLTEDLTATITVGGITANQKFNKNTSLEAVLKALLVKDIDASVSVVLTPTAGVKKKGTSVNLTNIKVTLTKGTCTSFEKITASVGGSEIGTVEPPTLTTETLTYNITVDENYTSDTTVNVILNCTQLSGKSDTKSGTAKYTFVDPSYVGVLSTPEDLTEVNITGLTEQLNTTKATSNVYNADNQIMVFAYPKSYGELASIVDTSTSYKLTWTKTTITINSIDYYVYYSGVCKVTNYSIKFS